MDYNVGIGGTADAALHGLIVRQRVAVGAEQGLAGLPLNLPFVRPGITLLEIHLAVPEMEQGDHAVAVKELVVLKHGRQLGIGVHAVEGAVKLFGDLALDFQIKDIAFQAQGTQIAGKTGGIRVVCHGRVLVLPGGRYPIRKVDLINPVITMPWRIARHPWNPLH